MANFLDSTSFPTINAPPMLLWNEVDEALYAGVTGIGHWVQVSGSPGQQGVTGLTGPISASSTNTLTNKRNQPRVYNTASNTSLVPEISTYDVFEITALAGSILINNHSTSTPAADEKMIIRLKDDGTARGISYGSYYRAMGNALPSTTVLLKTMYMGFIWNSTDTKWDLIALAQEM